MSPTKVLSGLLLMLFLLSFQGCEKTENIGTGILKGKISIGPICPVERDPPDPGCLPTAETYKAYPVYIRPLNSIKKILITPAADGSFVMELAPGLYYLTLDREQGGIGSSNLPMTAGINAGLETELSISIDTGIR